VKIKFISTVDSALIYILTHLLNTLYTHIMSSRLNNQRRPKRAGGRKSKVALSRYTAYERSSLTFLDPHRYMTFKYYASFTFTVTLGTAVQQTMNLNSLFDPDRTGVGHQPYGYDQMAALYNRYRVLRTKFKITFGTGVGSANVLVLPLNGLLPTAITTQATYDTAAENPRSRVSIQGGQGAPSITFHGNIALNNLNGCTMLEYKADDRFEAQIGASPTEVMVLNIAVLNLTVATLTVPADVTLSFYTDLHDPISLGGS